MGSATRGATQDFTLFYMGINLGSFLSSIFCGYLGIVYGWKYGFGLAGIGMLLGRAAGFCLGSESIFDGHAEPPDAEKLKKVLSLVQSMLRYACYLAGLAYHCLLDVPCHEFAPDA